MEEEAMRGSAPAPSNSARKARSQRMQEPIALSQQKILLRQPKFRRFPGVPTALPVNWSSIFRSKTSTETPSLGLRTALTARERNYMKARSTNMGGRQGFQWTRKLSARSG